MSKAGVSSTPTPITPTPKCMKGISIIHVGKRNFRVPTVLPIGSPHRDIYGKYHFFNVNWIETIILLNNYLPFFYFFF